MNNTDDLIGIIRSAIVFGRNEKHYDIIFYSNRIEILYIGEYKRVRIKQMFSRDADSLIYRIIKNKKRSEERYSKVTMIKADEVSSIKLRYISSKGSQTKPDYVLLEINTTKGKYEFYINAKISKTIRNIINKFYRRLREK